MDVYFDLPRVGELELDHVFYILDGEPILFVCKDSQGRRYLCSCCLMYEKWVVGRTDELTLINLIDDKITIRDVFEHNCDLKFLVSWDGKEFSLSFDSFDDMLPKVGATLELDWEKTGSYRDALRRSHQQRVLSQALEMVSRSLGQDYLQDYILSSFTIREYVQSTASAISEAFERCKHYAATLQTYQETFSVTDVMKRLDDTDNISNVVKSGSAPIQSVPIKAEKNPKKAQHKQTARQIDCFDCFAA